MSFRSRCSLAAVLGLLAGCSSPFGGDELALDPPPERTREINILRLEDRAVAPPVSVEDAAAQLNLLMADPPERDEPVLPATLNLEEVRAATLAHNLDLDVQVIAPEIARTSVDEAEARFEAILTAGINRSRTDSPVVLGTESSKASFSSMDVGLRLPLRTGGTATLTAPFAKSSTNNPFSLLDPAYTSDLRFSISQPLLRNAGVRVNTHSIRVAKYQEHITSARTKLEAMRILAAADRAYWRLYAVQRELGVREQQYRLAMDQLERAQRRVVAGDVAPIETLRAEAGLAERVEAIIIVQTSVRSAERDLKRIMNRDDLPLDGDRYLELTTVPDPVGLKFNADALVDFALAERMEMLELELQLAIDASSIDIARNARLPLVTLDYTYNINGLGSSYRKAFHQMNDLRFADWSVGVRAEIPIGNEVAKAGVQRAILQRLQSLATKSQREQAIRQEIHDAVDRLKQNWQRIIAARHDAIVAGRTWEAEQRQFTVGSRTSTDVLDAAARLADAQSREILAVTDYQIAQIDLAFATGTLLGYGKVRWDVRDAGASRSE